MRKVTPADKNIFEDLGFDKAEAANLKIRSELMMIIKDHITQKKLTQSKAAKLMGVDQPRISKLLQGHIELFTIDVLIKMLERVGIHMQLKRAA